jgi:undecaprenyl diphosphate synthase
LNTRRIRTTIRALQNRSTFVELREMIDKTDPKIAAPGSVEESLLRQLDPARLPRHVAIIMDGNGRWARQRRLPRVAGHRAGVGAVRETVEVAARLGLEMLTLYAFSRENWKRPSSEVGTLMALLREFLKKELSELVGNDIRLAVIGRLDDLEPEVRRDVEQALAATASNSGMELCIALSYGGRTEIVDACRSIMRSGVNPDELDPELFAQHLYTAGRPEPDLLIRTSGELRVSNFLLWQIAYAEIWVTDTLWPDFRRRQLLEALLEFQRRERRYGGLTRGDRGRATVARS